MDYRRLFTYAGILAFCLSFWGWLMAWVVPMMWRIGTRIIGF